MIRRSILSYARATLVPVLVLVLAAAAMPVPLARSQDRATQDRLERLEKDLTMLQRQVYRGGPTQVVSAGSGAAVDTELRMDRLETQMRELTGRVEDAVNGVEQLRRRLEQINSDIDVRLGQGQLSQGQLSQGQLGQGQPRSTPANSHASAGIADAGPAGPIATRGAPSVLGPATPSPPRSLMPPGTLVPPPRDPPTGKGTLTPPGPIPPGPETTTVAAAGSVRPPPAAPLSGASAPEEYNYAYGLLKQSDYPAAEEAFRAFVGQHPDDALAASAQYWLGETYYVRGKYTEAASAFAEGYRRFPKGTKAADDLLKLGMSLARANQKQNACVALAQLDRDFPTSGSNIKERAAAEKKRLGC